MKGLQTMGNDKFAEIIDNVNNKYSIRCEVCGEIHYLKQMELYKIKTRKGYKFGATCPNYSFETVDYTNLCAVNNDSNALQILNTQLEQVESISEPLSYYGKSDGYDGIKIAYISDIHILHHCKDVMSFNDIRKYIHKTVEALYESMGRCKILVFGGDISSTPDVTMEFYKQFVHYADFLKYKDSKHDLLRLLSDETEINKLESQIRKLERYINIINSRINGLKDKLSPHLDFKLVENYKNRYGWSYGTWVDIINAYRDVKSYKEKKIPHRKCDKYLKTIAQELDLLDSIEKKYERYKYRYDLIKGQILEAKSTYNMSLEDISMSNYYTHHTLLSEDRKVIAVLGNHEYIGFDSVATAVEFYTQSLDVLGIKLLHNDYIYDPDENYVLYGGTGFAKYNEQYNADNVVCCDDFSREDEIKESEKFEEGYIKAKEFSSDNGACFICLSHYPAKDCLSQIDYDSIYIYGHNHQNYHQRNEAMTIYADNQIGYTSPYIQFKILTTGVEINPYFELDDGLYKTTVKDYLQFYRYLGESVGNGTLLLQRSQSDDASMYVIKRKGFYGFFIMREKGSSKGISIVNGGKTKRITKSIDLQWLFDNFEVVLMKYLRVLTPLRLAQEQISKELKELDFSGNIHGCIIDIDFEHHVMLNPVDGTVTYYYSPLFGLVKPIASFDQVLLSVQKHDTLSCKDYKLIQEKYEDKKQESNYLLGTIKESYCIGAEDFKLQSVSRSEGMYGISRKISPLQRLFSGHVLRDFDLNLVDTEPVATISVKKN